MFSANATTAYPAAFKTLAAARKFAGSNDRLKVSAKSATVPKDPGAAVSGALKRLPAHLWPRPVGRDPEMALA